MKNVVVLLLAGCCVLFGYSVPAVGEILPPTVVLPDDADVIVSGTVPGYVLRTRWHEYRLADFNGDGVGDLTVSGGGEGPRIFLGGLGRIGRLELSTADIHVVRSYVETLPGQGGYCDVNGDGFDDLLTNDAGADPLGRIDAGIVYVVFGSANPPATITVPEDADIIINGAAADDTLRLGTRAGDVNGDGFEDLLLRADRKKGPLDPIAGIRHVYVILGGPHLGSGTVLELATDASGVFNVAPVGINSRPDTRYAGDLNGDGFNEIVIQDWAQDWQRGEIYVIFGHSGIGGEFDLPSDADVVVNNIPGNSFLGLADYGGDINGDGLDDVFAAPHMDSGIGEAYCIFGSPSLPPAIEVPTETELTLIEEFQVGLHPRPAGDYNDDGFDDLLIVRVDRPHTISGASVIFGPIVSGGLISIPTEAEVNFEPLPPAVQRIRDGTSGDFNADGVDDIILTDFYADLPNQPPEADAGEDQTVEATGPAGAAVALDGSGSLDSFGYVEDAGQVYVIFGGGAHVGGPPAAPHTDDSDIVSYQWFEGGALIATGKMPPVEFSPGQHTVTLRVTDTGGATDEDSVSITVTTVTSAIVAVDVKPGDDANTINLKSGGVIPVAILTTEDFDAACVDPFSLTLQGAAVRVKGKSGNAGSLVDVDGDGDLDLLVHFINELALAEGATTATLEGMTYDGVPIRGSDSIRIVP